MKKTAFKTKIDDTLNDFFDTEHVYENAALQNFDNNAKPSKLEKQTLAHAPNSLTVFLKQALLFFPGTFLLYFMSLAIGIALRDIIAQFYKTLPFTKGFYVFLALGFLASLMTWCGLGDIKNKKHMVIPASIISTGFLIGAVVGLTDDIFWLARKITDDFGYAVYLFPIGVIVPFLAKGWVDRKSESK
jgi:hypothetical protein